METLPLCQWGTTGRLSFLVLTPKELNRRIHVRHSKHSTFPPTPGVSESQWEAEPLPTPGSNETERRVIKGWISTPIPLPWYQWSMVWNWAYTHSQHQWGLSKVVKGRASWFLLLPPSPVVSMALPGTELILLFKDKRSQSPVVKCTTFTGIVAAEPDTIWTSLNFHSPHLY